MKCQQVEVEVAVVEFISVHSQLFHLSGCATLAYPYNTLHVDGKIFFLYILYLHIYTCILCSPEFIEAILEQFVLTRTYLRVKYYMRQIIPI